MNILPLSTARGVCDEKTFPCGLPCGSFVTSDSQPEKEINQSETKAQSKPKLFVLIWI